MQIKKSFCINFQQYLKFKNNTNIATKYLKNQETFSHITQTKQNIKFNELLSNSERSVEIVGDQQIKIITYEFQNIFPDITLQGHEAFKPTGKWLLKDLEARILSEEVDIIDSCMQQLDTDYEKLLEKYEDTLISKIQKRTKQQNINLKEEVDKIMLLSDKKFQKKYL